MASIVLEDGGLELTLCPPDLQEGYYRGTRLDHSGIFRRNGSLERCRLVKRLFDKCVYGYSGSACKYCYLAMGLRRNSNA